MKPLDLFLPAVRDWFTATLGTPTPVQAQGWPVIAAGQSTLLLAPTGSGKTLAAFLACLDTLWRMQVPEPGVRVLYLSPLKALNNDIHRNLQLPLHGVESLARERGEPLPALQAAVRTGDTPSHERLRMLRKPPQVLITTPESLHLLLTSKGREMLRGVTHCIVDEIHALCPNKRGVFLALLLERLQALCPRPLVRIGLSATQRPLDEVARYLGGLQLAADGSLEPRPVAIVDAGFRKDFDLQILTPFDQSGPLPEPSIWPSIYRKLAHEIESHQSTIVFANNRRTVERLTAQLGLLCGEGVDEAAGPPGEWVRAHHGSIALEVRQATERALKEGRLRAVVATASLELGIDMGAVELVCQVESTGNVARALQRVGRAGHLVGQKSKGRLIPKTLPDLLNQAVLAREMSLGHVEPLQVPANCLDVLAQQIIAMVAMDDWQVETLYARVRQAYPYRNLTAGAFDSVLQMVSGRFQWPGEARPPEADAPADTKGPKAAPRLAALQPRIHWDRVHQRLQALPGSQRLALVHGGTIPDMGHYAVYAGQAQRIGELDEEFVYERRVGDAFLLGTSTWRIDRIEADRVLVSPAPGMPATVPFWHGETTGRSYHLGLAQGRFLREMQEGRKELDLDARLQAEYHLDAAASASLRAFVDRQLAKAGCLPTDRRIWIEASRNPLGDWQVIVLTVFGHRVHLGLRLLLEHALSRRLGYRPQCLHHDEGILIRLTDSDVPVLDLFEGLTPEGARDAILEELGDSALFGLRFRHNAARALLMPSGGAGKRAPLWLQRLRGRDLLQVARRFPDFPIVAETFRECLHDHLDLPHLEALLRDVRDGAIEVRARRLDAPSPMAAQLQFAFTMAYMYQYDDGAAEGSARASVDRELIDQLVTPGGHLELDPRAVARVDQRLRNVGLPPRTKAEFAEWLFRLGDASASELPGALAGFAQELVDEGRAEILQLPGVREAQRWVAKELAADYRAVFEAADPSREEARQAAAVILQRYLQTHALVGLEDLLARYPFERGWAEEQLRAWASQGRLVRLEPAGAQQTLQYAWPENFEQAQRGTLALLRREVITVGWAAWVDFLLRWQYVLPAYQRPAGRLDEVLTRLEGFALAWPLWEEAVLPARLEKYQPAQLEDLVRGGGWVWACQGQEVAFWQRASLASFPAPSDDEARIDAVGLRVLEVLRQRGAVFAAECAATLAVPEYQVRHAFWALGRAGLVTNDWLEVLRRGEPRDWAAAAAGAHGRRELTAMMKQARRRELPLPEGRWSLLGWGQPGPEPAALARTRLLLERYGVLSREVALLDPAAPPWRVLYEILSRLEMTGEVRRGYFVEGLTGAQFGLPEAVALLQESAAPSTGAAPAVLLHSLDPANVFGAGAPLDPAQLGIDLKAFPRRASHWLVVQAGKPVLLIENAGKNLATPPGVDPLVLEQAVGTLPRILNHTQRGDGRYKLTVETWNDQPVTATAGKALLEAAGFVRDYQAMTYFAAWR